MRRRSPAPVSRAISAVRQVGREEEIIEETLTFYWPPRQHRTQLKSTNMLKRLSEEIKRRRPSAIAPTPPSRPVPSHRCSANDRKAAA
jgi:Transposase, Mutator family